MENSSSARALPPQAPKQESPTKTVSSSTGSFKWTNKDFRKSALNVGPTDRPRKTNRSLSQDQSTPTENEENNVDKTASSPLLRRSDRSTSTCSEASSASTTTATTSSQSENEQQQKLVQKSKTSSQTSLLVSSQSIDDVPKNANNKNCKQSKTLVTSQNDVNATKTDDAKSFLVRALEPVTNLFKSKSTQLKQTKQAIIYVDENNSTSISESLDKDTESLQVSGPTIKSTDETDDPHCWMNNKNNNNTNNNHSRSNKSENNNQSGFGANMQHKLRHIDSGEIAWWMSDHDDENDTNNDDTQDDNDDTIADDLTMNQSEISDKSRDTSVDYNHQTSNVQRRNGSEEPAWWQTDEKDENSNEKSIKSAASPIPNKIKISHVQSGERAWWLSSESEESKKNPVNGTDHNSTSKSVMNECSTVTRSPSKKLLSKKQTSKENTPTDSSNSSKKSSVNEFKNKFKIRHVESGEKAWWMQDDAEAEFIKIKNGESSPQRVIHSNSDSNNNNNVVLNKNSVVNSINNNSDNVIVATNQNKHLLQVIDYDELGDRASPEGLEDTSKGRLSPYDNVKNNNQINAEMNARKMFISRHTNIDDLLGGSLSIDRYAQQENISINDVYEEILPSQVRIHDGTAKMPVIQYKQQNG